jgi:Tfp pilus assembly protein PilN
VIQINLAPAATGRRSRRRTGLSLPKLPAVGGDRRVLLAAFGGLLLLFAGGFLIWSTGQQQALLEKEIRGQAADSARFATTIELVQALRARQDTVARKIGVIREVDQRRYVWPHLLDEISSSVPTFTWLTEIRSTETRDSTGTRLSFTIQGNAGSTPALTRFMKNLEASPFVRDVTLVTSEQAEEQGRVVHRFALEARYESPDVSALETVSLLNLD